MPHCSTAGQKVRLRPGRRAVRLSPRVPLGWRSLDMSSASFCRLRSASCCCMLCVMKSDLTCPGQRGGLGGELRHVLTGEGRCGAGTRGMFSWRHAGALLRRHAGPRTGYGHARGPCSPPPPHLGQDLYCYQCAAVLGQPHLHEGAAWQAGLQGADAATAASSRHVLRCRRSVPCMSNDGWANLNNGYTASGGEQRYRPAAEAVEGSPLQTTPPPRTPPA